MATRNLWLIVNTVLRDFPLKSTSSCLNWPTVKSAARIESASKQSGVLHSPYREGICQSKTTKLQAPAAMLAPRFNAESVIFGYTSIRQPGDRRTTLKEIPHLWSCEGLCKILIWIVTNWATLTPKWTLPRTCIINRCWVAWVASQEGVRSNRRNYKQISRLFTNKLIQPQVISSSVNSAVDYTITRFTSSLTQQRILQSW